jgi:hypothetical protein
MTQGLQAGPFGTPDRFATTSQAGNNVQVKPGKPEMVTLW